MNKNLNAFGIASIEFDNLDMAKAYTYDDALGTFPPTPLLLKENPFNDEVLQAKSILEVGCGIGRNLPWILQHTRAKYFGLEPNPSMVKFFNDHHRNIQSERFEIHEDYRTLPKMKFDIVLITFVLQHITYRPQGDSMNVDDIIQMCFEFSHPDTVFILIEHEFEEEGWMSKWFKNNQIFPDVYIRNWTRKGKCSVTELTDRGSHDLIIFKRK
jgi:cyclopropane fatty-acyl-phospholipid synthase-like methyltransferase